MNKRNNKNTSKNLRQKIFSSTLNKSKEFHELSFAKASFNETHASLNNTNKKVKFQIK